MLVTHICTASRLVPVDIGRVGVTGIDKRPVTGPVKIGRYGVWGDVQCDRANHGGLDKAVYAMSNAEMAWWAQSGEDLKPGIFGENLRVDGDVDEIVIGSRYRFGSALLEATGCRTPCRTFAWWRGDEDWIVRFMARGRSGAYFRVIDPGVAQAGDILETLSVPSHGVTVGEWFRERPEPAPRLVAAHRSGDITLAPYLIKHMPRELRETL